MSDEVRKKFIPVIKNKDGKIVALAGIMLDDSFKVTSSTRNIIEFIVCSVSVGYQS